MIAEALELEKRLKNLTNEQRIKWTPTQMPPDFLGGEPVILLRFTEEWQNFFIIYAEACEKIEQTKRQNYFVFLNKITSDLVNLHTELENKSESSWTLEELKKRDSLFVEIKLDWTPTLCDKQDVQMKETFWDDLLVEINKKSKEYDYDTFRNFKGEIGIFADEEGWCVAGR